MISQNDISQKCEERLKELRNQSDDQTNLTCLQCLFSTKQYQDVIELAPIYLQKTEKNYYAIKKIQIEALLMLQDDMQALLLLEEERKMPYTPQPYHDFFEKTYREIKKRLSQLQKPQNPFAFYQDYELNEILLENKNNEILLVTINELSNRNIRLFLPTIKIFLLDASQKNYLKVALLETLANQGVQTLVKTSVSGLICEVIPTDLTPLLAIPTIREVMAIVYEVESKNKSILDVCEGTLIAYLASTYPLEVDEEENTVYAAAVFLLANRDFGIELDLDEVAKKFGVKPTILKHYCDQISNLAAYL